MQLTTIFRWFVPVVSTAVEAVAEINSIDTPTRRRHTSTFHCRIAWKVGDTFAPLWFDKQTNKQTSDCYFLSDSNMAPRAPFPRVTYCVLLWGPHFQRLDGGPWCTTRALISIQLFWSIVYSSMRRRHRVKIPKASRLYTVSSHWDWGLQLVRCTDYVSIVSSSINTSRAEPLPKMILTEFYDQNVYLNRISAFFRKAGRLGSM